MKFENLKERMEYFKSLADYKLTPNSYVIAHIDGRAFSKLVKNRFKLPFDDDFISMMNATAAYVCKNVQGCKMAYVQSDEISLVITDFDTLNTDSFFSYRLCKMQSIIASLATAKFNSLYMLYLMTHNEDIEPDELFSEKYLAQFDCKCFNVPTYNDAFAWIKYRQNDCMKNSKNQTCQTYLPHRMLVKLNSDEQIELLKQEKGIDWNDLPDDRKYGRLIYKEDVEMENEHGKFTRSQYIAHPAEVITRGYFDNLNIVPDRDKIEFDGINEEKPYSVVGRYGVVTKEPDGMFKMPFYFGKLDGDECPVMFVVAHKDDASRDMKVGDRFYIHNSRMTEDGPLYFESKAELKQ